MTKATHFGGDNDLVADTALLHPLADELLGRFSLAATSNFSSASNMRQNALTTH